MKLRFLFLALALVSVLIFAGCASGTGTSSSTAAATSSTTTPLATNDPAITVTPNVSVIPATSAPAAVQFPLTFKDDYGRSITLNSMPKRIVSLSPSNTEIVYALGLGSQLVGDTTYCDYPEAAKTVAKVGGFSDVDIEKVVSVQPDLILASDIHEEKVIPSLQALNIPVVDMHPVTISGIFQDIALLGSITGKAAEAKAVVTDLQNRVDIVKAKTANATVKPGVLYVTWHDPIYSAGDDTITGELIRLAGGTNVAAELSGYATLTLESVIQKNPQIIVVMSSMGDQVSLDYINSEPRLAVTDALKNKKVFPIDADLFGRTTPRIVDALEQLQAIIHPELTK